MAAGSIGRTSSGFHYKPAERIANMNETHTAEHHPRLGFWRKYVFSTDHKIIGLQYLITAMAMAIVGGTLSMLMRYQLAWPSLLSPTMEKLLPTAFQGGVMAPEFYIS